MIAHRDRQLAETVDDEVGVSPDRFLAAMRCLAATVHVITVRSETGPMGMTATAVSSLAASPPSLLVCVNRSASLHAALVSTRRFCVNILHSSQRDLARIFSDSHRREERFDHGAWQLGGNGPPQLADAQVALLCELDGLSSFATHDICIGRVRDVHLRAEAPDPLLYLEGRFARAS